jgi:RimJ/RimL family protein N-acetyltransferase
VLTDLVHAGGAAMTPGLTIREGPRIRIRQLREDDIPRMAAGAFGGEEGARRWYAEAMALPDGPGPSKQYVVETRAGECIGFTGFGAERGGDAGGYFTIDEPFQGQGYGTELVGLVLRVMFEDCGAARCVIDYHDWNEVAARLYAKFGFEEFRRVRIPEDKLTDEDWAMAPDRPVHAVVLELTRERWEARQT